MSQEEYTSPCDARHTASAPLFTTNAWDLMWSSADVLREVEESGQINTRTHYVPTDWGKDTSADYRDLMGGFKEKNGTCDRCFQIRAANGACAC